MTAVADTDIISTFAKVKRLQLLAETFNDNIVIPSAVKAELEVARDIGYDSLTPALNLFDVVHVEQELATSLYEDGLGKGEASCIAYCICRDTLLITNDQIAQRKAEEHDVTWADLNDVLWTIHKEERLTNDELEALINDIETKDYMTIQGKDTLLNDDTANST